MQMYGKLFASLYQGTIRGKPHEILVFTNLLAHMDKDYNVDKHPRAIADEVGLTVEEVRAALKYLESPDPESRSPEHEGRRILRIDEHRDWGWHMVNGKKYNGYRSEEDRKEQNRLAQQRWRARHGSNADVSNSKQTVSTDKQDKPTKDLILKTEDGIPKTEEGRNAEALAPAAPVPAKKRKSAAIPDDEWLASLAADEAYNGLNVPVVLAKCRRWCETARKPFSRKRIVNWLNNEHTANGTVSGRMTVPVAIGPDDKFWEPNPPQP